MISPVELHRILAEWRVRLHRAKEILQPPTWNEKEWRQFSQALALMVRDHGRSWIIDPNVYWDLRWNLQDGGELVCQIEHIPGRKDLARRRAKRRLRRGGRQLHLALGRVQHGGRISPAIPIGSRAHGRTRSPRSCSRSTARATTCSPVAPRRPIRLLLQDGARPNDRNSLALTARPERIPLDVR